MKQKLYGMEIRKGFFNDYVHSSEFNKAKCPICNKIMTYKHSVMVIQFTCKNTKCKGYYHWLQSYRKTFFGHLGY